MPEEIKRQVARPAAEHTFVDREEPIATFEAALKAPRTKPLVLVFHGGAGTGKSRLRRELTKLVNCGSPDPPDPRTPEPRLLAITATLDFDVPINRQPDAALLFLRRAIGEAREVGFPSFDLAYAIVWQKTHPDAPLADELKPLLRPGSLLSKLLDESGKLPLIGLIPKISKLIAPSLDPSTTRPLDHFLTDWWDRRGESELEDLPQMEPGAIVEQLPKLWASDFKELIAHRSSLIASRGAVLFIDSYEKLWGTVDDGQRTGDEGQKTDAWVRELVKQLPEVLWVISGRRKLRWEEAEKEWADVVNQHELGALPDHSAREFLSSCGITDEPTRNAIAKGSQGLPHYLNLAADTFLEIRQSGQRVPSTSTSQADTPEELFAQFVRHLNQPEIATLEVLSASRFWNYGLFEHLVTEYQTGYPLTGYDDLKRFSFVGEGAASETRSMHDLMREALQDHQAPELRNRVHLFLHEYYARQLEGLDVKGITEQHKAALTEAFYHGRQSKSAAEVWEWFEQKFEVFNKGWQNQLLTLLLEEVVRALEGELGPRCLGTAQALHDLAISRYFLGEFDSAETLLRRALAVKEEVLGPEHLGTADTLERMAVLSEVRGRYEESESLYRRALAIFEERLGLDDYRVAHALDNLGTLLDQMGRFDESESLRRRSLAAMEKVMGPGHVETARLLINLATTLRRQGKYVDAEALARRSVVIEEEVLGPESPELAFSLNALGMLLVEQCRFAEGEPLLRRALAIRERSLGPEHPDTANSVNDLSLVLRHQGRYAEAEPLARRGLATMNKKLGAEHPEVGYYLYAVAAVLLCERKYDEAEPLARRQLAIWEAKLGPEHPNVAWPLDMLADLLIPRRRYTEAEPLARRSLAIREKAMGPEHPGVADSLDVLATALAKQGRYAEAEPLAKRGLAIREAALQSFNPELTRPLELLAELCEQTGRAAEAQEYSARAKEIREKNAQTAQVQAASPS